MSEFSFHKGERLSGAKTISSLFQSGRSVVSHPFRIIYSHSDATAYPVRVAISVPKRLFKRAVDRNLIKRRIREAYRLNKKQFYPRLEALEVRLNIVVQYQHREIIDYQSIQAGLVKGMNKVVQQVSRGAVQASPNDGSAT